MERKTRGKKRKNEPKPDQQHSQSPRFLLECHHSLSHTHRTHRQCSNPSRTSAHLEYKVIENMVLSIPLPVILFVLKLCKKAIYTSSPPSSNTKVTAYCLSSLGSFTERLSKSGLISTSLSVMVSQSLAESSGADTGSVSVTRNLPIPPLLGIETKQRY